MDAAKQANAEQFLDACSHSKEFIFVSMMGEFKDYSQFEIYVKGLYVDLKSEDIAEGTETFSVITDSAVLWTYIGSNMVTDKKGNQTPIRPYGLTMLVKKENGKWKTFYIHT